MFVYKKKDRPPSQGRSLAFLRRGRRMLNGGFFEDSEFAGVGPHLVTILELDAVGDAAGVFAVAVDEHGGGLTVSGAFAMSRLKNDLGSRGNRPYRMCF